jgi:hypothetical protein
MRNSTGDEGGPFPALHKGGADLPAHGKPQGGSTFARTFQIENTLRYLGIEVDDAIEIAEKIDI